MLAGTSAVAGADVFNTVVPERIWSVTVVVMTRADGLVAYTCVSTVIGPLRVAGSRSQDTVIPTDASRAPAVDAQLSAIDTVAGVASLVMFQT